MVWYAPASNLYSIPVPRGDVTVTLARLNPRVQSVVCNGAAGAAGWALTTALAEETDVHPPVVTFVTV